jgi:hypothetical protein
MHALKLLAYSLCLLLSACASITPRNDSADREWQISKPLDDVASCLVSFLDGLDGLKRVAFFLMRQDAKKRVNLARFLAQTKRNSLYRTR